MENNFFHEWIGNLTFQYKIQDNDISLDIDTFLHETIAKAMLNEYYYVSLQNFDMELGPIRNFLKQNPVNIYLNYRISNNITSLLEVINHRLIRDVCYMLYESKFRASYFFFFQSILGGTFVIFEGSLICNKNEAALIAFEGPPVDMVRMDSLLLHLQEWNCGHSFDRTDRNMELKGRIGDMTAVLVVEKRNTISNYSLLLRSALRAIEITPSVAIHHEVNLTSNRMQSMHFAQTRTYFYHVDINAVKGFVNVAFKNMTFTGYTDSGCTCGGFFLLHKYLGETRHIGGACSCQGAKQLVRLYGRRGITLNERIIIYLKQYIFLTKVHATLIFSVDHCWGYFNFLPENADNLDRYIIKGDWSFASIRERFYYGHGSNSYYHLYGNQVFLGMKHLKPKYCIKFQYSIFDNMRRDQIKYIITDGKSVFGIDHLQNIQPSLTKVAFWNINNELARFSSCAEEGFRFYPDNRNDEPYIYLINPGDEPWSTTAFTSKIGIDMACLLFSGAFHIQSENISPPVKCFTEVGGYLYDAVQPIILRGICGGPSLHLMVGEQWLGFQNPLAHQKYCEIDLLVTSVDSQCNTVCLLYQLLTENGTRSWFVHRWISETNTPDRFMYREDCVTRDYPIMIDHMAHLLYKLVYIFPWC